MWTVPYMWLTELVSPKPAINQLLRRRGKLESIPPAVNGSDVYFLVEGNTGEGNRTVQVRKGTETYFGFCILTHDTVNYVLLLAFSESGLFLSFDLQISSGQFLPSLF